MNSRARELLPSVLLTLISIIQALALELLWARLGEQPLWTLSWVSVVSWAQLVAMILGFLQVWLFYTSIVMRFRWVPAFRDSILPFVIGILEFALVALMGPEHFGPWFYTLALVFATSIWTSHDIFKRARRDPENREFFKTVRPAAMRDHVASIATVSGLLLLGVILHVSGNQSWLALVALLVAVGALGFQVESTRQYWVHSMIERRA